MSHFFHSKTYHVLTSALLVALMLLEVTLPLTSFAQSEEGVTDVTTETTITETAEVESGDTAVAEDEDSETDESEDPAPEAPESEMTEDTPSATVPNEEAIDTPAETVIETGDATAASSLDSDINVNKTSTTPSSAASTTPTETEAASGAASSSETTGSTTTSKGQFGFASDTGSTTIANDNQATSTTHSTTTADTGSNAGSGATVTIDTGNAVAYADVVNVVNTNITNAEGLIEFFNETLGYQNFDIRDEFDLAFSSGGTALTTPACSLSDCSSDAVYTVNNDNDAFIENNIVVNATTGGNRATGTSATITTGNAYASANVINVANTNITDSNYLLLVFNNFADFAGNIVLPNSRFFDTLMARNDRAVRGDITNTNAADIENNVSVGADTGSNVAGPGGTITTGDATATGDVQNLINQNFLNTNSFSMVIKVHGDWSGEVFGLPEGMAWDRTPDGLRLYSMSGGGAGTQNIAVSNTNSATIRNNVSVFALTGDNRATGSEAAITTGNAYAEANILNIANTNVVGSNWSNLIFNIYGNWNGHLTFGESDLWLGLQADSGASTIYPGDTIAYTYTVMNRGDSTAHNVVVAHDEQPGLAFTNHAGPTLPEWNLGDIAPGETVEVTHFAKASSQFRRDTLSALPLTATVTSHEPDGNPGDNTDTVTVYVGEEPDSKKNDDPSFSPSFSANIDIVKTADRERAQPGDTVTYTVTFTNRGGQLFDAALVDILSDPNGTVISEQMWPLETMHNDESITVEYTLDIPVNAATGTYTNTAQVFGLHQSFKRFYQRPYVSNVAEHSITVGGEPQVLGLSTCTPYLTTYLRYGEPNDPVEVQKLEAFLNDHMNAGLTVDGTFSLETEIAVRAFQERYRDEVLDPWGLDDNSGYVYYTTQKKINDIMCAGVQSFPLTMWQQKEILSFRAENVYNAIAQRQRISPEKKTIATASPEADKQLFRFLSDLEAEQHVAQERRASTTELSVTKVQLSDAPREVSSRTVTTFEKLYRWFRVVVDPILTVR